MKGFGAVESALTRVCSVVYAICKYLVILLTVEISLVISANIFGRYILDASIYWAEEVVRYSFVWATFIGATCAYKQRALISMSVFTHRLSPQMQWKIGLVLDGMMGLFLLVSFVFGAKLTFAVLHQRSASLEISMAIVYFCIPLSCLFMLLFNLDQILTVLRQKRPLVIWGEEKV
jgi:TRAP-type C4-dicarboxylate transport system permease small subunit